MSQKGIQPIIGCNLSVKNEKHIGSIVLLCTRREGYKNLIKLSSEIYINDHGEEMVDFIKILERNEGLICLSGGQNGLINNLLVNNQKKDALKIVDKLNSAFKDRFYIEIQRTGFDNVEEWVLNGLRSIGDPSDLWWQFQRDGHPRYRFTEKYAFGHLHEASDVISKLNEYNIVRGHNITRFIGKDIKHIPLDEIRRPDGTNFSA